MGRCRPNCGTRKASLPPRPALMLTTTRRLLEIRRVARAHGLGELFGERAPRWFFGRGRQFDTAVAVRLRQALEQLGPVFIKFGQALSTRRDLLPAGLADELSKLQDAVPPFPGEQARALIEAAYGKSLDDVFEHFDTQPLAAASIAQVHVARLLPQAGEAGAEVVVKVLRPGVHAQVARDMAVLARLARLAERFVPRARRFRVTEVVSEYNRVISDELDLLR